MDITAPGNEALFQEFHLDIPVIYCAGAPLYQHRIDRDQLEQFLRSQGAEGGWPEGWSCIVPPSRWAAAALTLDPQRRNAGGKGSCRGQRRSQSFPR